MDITTNTSNTSKIICLTAYHETTIQAGYIGLEIIAMAGIISNVLGVIALKMMHEEFRPVHRFLVNLSIVDIVTCISTSGITPYHFWPCSKVIQTIHFISKNVFNTCLLSQAGSLLILALDHYFAIVTPLRYCLILNKRCCFMLITIQWIGTTAITSASIACTLLLSQQDGLYDIAVYCEAVRIVHFLYFGLVLGSMTLIYIRVLFEIKKITDRNLIGASTLRHNAKAIKTTFLILGTYFAFVIPTLVTKAMNTAFIPIIRIIFLCWLLMNSICDPFIYSLRMRDVRQGYRIMLNRCKCHGSKVSPIGVLLNQISPQKS